MTERELGIKLKEMYDEGLRKKEAKTYIHLFGIRYADVILNNELNRADIIKFANISASYDTEIYTGVKLSKYVELKHL